MTATNDSPCQSFAQSGLSGSQEWALDWLRRNGPASKRQFKATGVEIRAKTMQSLVDRGLACWDKSGCAVVRTQIEKESHEI